MMKSQARLEDRTRSQDGPEVRQQSRDLEHTNAKSVHQNDLIPAYTGASDNRGLNCLVSPQTILVNLIFVHGLGGHPRKTWSKGGSAESFWPQAWLPLDTAFKNAQIFSFGYRADIGQGKNPVFDIHHFGQALLSELSMSPHLSQGISPIILLGHSMGGLVSKKAYLLARKDPIYEGIYKRIQAMVFLATPHNGTNSAFWLQWALQATFGARSYVRDLKQGSQAIRDINAEFSQCSAGLGLWSFYETQEQDLWRFRKIIVAPNSAVLNYPGERRIPMNADHRSICKFDSPLDANYLLVRNALASIVNSLTPQGVVSMTPKAESPSEIQARVDRQQLEAVRDFLNVDPQVNPSDDLRVVQDARLDGTCTWILEKPAFNEWKQSETSSPATYLLMGDPGSGKSVLAGYVASLLEESSCSYFFFKHDNGEASRLSCCLRSLAYQMACSNVNVRRAILEAREGEPSFDCEDWKIVWRRMFESVILKVALEKHYWIIDALDECIDSVADLGLAMKRINNTPGLRVFITSRENQGILRLKRHSEPHILLDKIDSGETTNDIQLYAEQKSKMLPGLTFQSNYALAMKVAEKSQGSFLWTTVMLEQLSKAHAEGEIDKILNEVDPNMGALYQRIINSICCAGRSRELTKSILLWVVGTIRPLSVQELKEALELEIGETLISLESAVSTFCGQLVVVDGSSKVKLVHTTARDFLTDAGLDSDFAVDSTIAHTRIAEACFAALSGPRLRPSRASRQSSSSLRERQAGFLKYACEFAFEHLAKASPASEELFGLAVLFLQQNILSWIEYVVTYHDVSFLIRAAQDLMLYWNSCMQKSTETQSEMQLIKSWVTGLVQVTSKFSRLLKESPSSIYTHIPPFCPLNSAILKTKVQRRRVSVVGLSDNQWDDRIVSFEFNHGAATAIDQNERFFAISLMGGSIILYDAHTLQEQLKMDNEETVRFLQFNPHSSLLASCGIRKINIWNVSTGRQLHSFESPSRPLMIKFRDGILSVATNDGLLASWDIIEGAREHRRPDRPWRASVDSAQASPNRQPSAITISDEHKLLAVAYTNDDIILWDLEEDMYYGRCGKKLPSEERSRHPVTCMVFNPDPSVELLAIAYLDGELSIIDPFRDEELKKSRMECSTMAASPNGKFLACGGSSGTIKIYIFETLQPVYEIKCSTLFVKQIQFSLDGTKLFNIQSRQFNAWAPQILLPGMSTTCREEERLMLPAETVAIKSNTIVTCMAIDEKEQFAICGMSDGAVNLYDLRTGLPKMELYRHKVFVRLIYWWSERSLIISLDSANKVIAWSFERVNTGNRQSRGELFQQQVQDDLTGTQILPSSLSNKILLSTRGSVHLWTPEGLEEHQQLYETFGQRFYLQHPNSTQHIISFDATSVRIWTWDSLTEVASYPLPYQDLDMQLKSLNLYEFEQTHAYLIEVVDSKGGAGTRSLDLIDANMFPVLQEHAKNLPTSESTDTLVLHDDRSDMPYEESEDFATYSTKTLAPVLEIPSEISTRVVHVFGLNSKGHVAYLDRDSWVCSVDLQSVGPGALRYYRHFFLPYGWFSSTWGCVASLTKRDLVFARDGDVAIVKGGMEISELLTLEPAQS